MNPKLKILCDLYDKSDENIDTYSLLKVCFFKDLDEILNLLSHKQCVRFAYLCAKSVLYLLNDEEKKKEEKCSKIIERWLEKPSSVEDWELIDIAFTIYDENNPAIYSFAHTCYSIGPINKISSSYSSYSYSISAVKNKQEQRYKNLGFLVRVIRDEP